MYKFKPLFVWHVSMLYTFSCMLVANDNELHPVCIMTGCKWQDL
jgi:hypothetical protein